MIADRLMLSEIVDETDSLMFKEMMLFAEFSGDDG